MKKFDKGKYLRKLKFKRLWSKYQRYVYLGVSCLVVAIIGIYFAYSKFSTSSEEEVIRTTVGNFIYGDVIATPYIDGEYSLTFPGKKTGINVEKIVCDNNTSASWDEEKWGLLTTNLSKRTKCNVYFVTPASCGINDNVSCISSREELATLATEVNNGDNKSGKIIYLTSDLDLGGKFDSNGNALDGNISWTPIGSEAKPFSGTFDGNGHIITNMYMNRPTENFNGLFGSATNGFIKNLGITNSYIIGYRNSGTISGSGGTISNSFNLGTIKGIYARTGGLCGITCNISNSYNGGSVINGYDDLTGGILSAWGTVENSYNYGNVSSDANSVGGIVGWMGSAINTYNLGNVSAKSNATGGILGCGDNPNKVVNNYNSGKCNYSGILGYQYGKSSANDMDMIFEKNYYLEGSASYGISLFKSNSGAEPLTKDQMPSVISVINGDNAFVEDVNNINNGYPILKWQAERENN